MGEKNDTLESLRATLSSPDYIMEPTVLDTVRKYCGKGGKPPEVIELLSDNYRAMAQHVNLLAEWLILRYYQIFEPILSNQLSLKMIQRNVG